MATQDRPSGSSGKNNNNSSGAPKAAPVGQFFGTPITYFPQYSMAGMFPQLPPAGPAQYLNGAWSLPPPVPPAPTPPITPPANPNPGWNNNNGGSSDWVNRLRNRVGRNYTGMFGGGTRANA